MSDYLTEQQQIEQLRLWWKKYGWNSILVIALALLVSVGWHFWLQHREVKRERASMHYQTLLTAVVNNDTQEAVKEATLLTNDYAQTPYAALATLILARNDVYQNNYSQAEKRLTWVMKHASTPSLRQVARIRLARVLLQENKAPQVLKILHKINDPAYLPMIDETKGDAYAQLNNVVQAKDAYQEALTILPTYAAARPIVQMKLDNLPQS